MSWLAGNDREGSAQLTSYHYLLKHSDGVA